MLSVNIPRGATLERIVVAPDGESRKAPCGLTFSRESARKRIGGASARSCRADPRGDAGDRADQPALCGERRALMTATMMCRSDTDNPTTTAVTFILADRRLITVSYDEPRPFTLVKNLLGRRGSIHAADVDRLALWNELQAHAGTRLGFRLSSGDLADDRRRDHSLRLFQDKEVIVISGIRRSEAPPRGASKKHA